MRTFALLLALIALPLVADAEDPYEKAIREMAQKNVFAPYKAKPKPIKRAPRIKKTKPKPAKVVEIREDLIVTGFMWDNKTERYVAFVETRDGQKSLELAHGTQVGDFKVKVVLREKLVIEKGGKTTEIGLGESFKGGVIGKETVYGGSSSSSSITKSGTKTTATKPLPKLDAGKKMSIIEKLKARRAAQMKKRNKGKK